MNGRMYLKINHLLKRVRFCLIAGIAVFALTGCETIDSWFSTPKPPLPGKRISVMVGQRSIQPDARLKDKQILLPPPTPNADWPQAGGYANHAMHHVQAGDSLKPIWKEDIGDGSGSEVRLIASPVVAKALFTQLMPIPKSEPIRLNQAGEFGQTTLHRGKITTGICQAALLMITAGYSSPPGLPNSSPWMPQAVK